MAEWWYIWALPIICFGSGVYAGWTFRTIKLCLHYCDIVNDEDAWKKEKERIQRDIVELIPPQFRGR